MRPSTRSFSVRVLAVALVLGGAACSNHDKPSNSDKMSAQELWDLAQKDDSTKQKPFTVTGSLTEVDGNRAAIKTDAGRVDLWFDPTVAQGLKVGSPVTASCTLAGITPRSVRLEACQLR